MRRSPRWAFGVAAALTLASRAAYADGSGDQRSAAQVLFDRAQALVEQNHFAEACPQFAESERLDPRIGSLLWLADCYENIGQTANAWTTFEEAASMAAARRDGREAVARDRAASLQARLSRVTIVVPSGVADTPGLEVHCDGVRIESTLWGHAIALDPGMHTITARADDRQVWWTTVQLVPGGVATSVAVPELATLPAPGASPHDKGSEGIVQVGPSTLRSPSRRATQQIAGGALAAGGAVGLVVGTVFSLHAKAKYDDSNAFCLTDNECSAIGKQDRSDASSMATVATIAMGLGAAALVGGAVLYFTAPRRAPLVVAFAPADRGGSVRMKWSW